MHNSVYNTSNCQTESNISEIAVIYRNFSSFVSHFSISSSAQWLFWGPCCFLFFVLVSFWVILLSVCTYCECQKITNTKIVSSACMNKLFAPHSVRRNLPHYSDADFKCTQSHACTCVGISGTTCHRRPSCPQPCRCLTEAVWVVFLYFLRITFPSSSFDTPRPA